MGEGIIVGEVKEKRIRTPAQRRQARIAFVFLLVIAAGGAAAYFALSKGEDLYVLKNYSAAKAELKSIDNAAQGSGSVEVLIQFKLLSESAGYAAEAWVENGDKVRYGQALARLDVPDLEKSLAKARDDLEDAVLNLEKYALQQEYSVAKLKRSIAKLEDQIAQAKIDLEASRRLAAAGSASQSEVKQKADSLASLESSLEENKASLEESVRVYDIDYKIKEKAIADMRETIKDYEKQIAAALVKSPIDGDVLSVNGSLLVPGTRIANGAELFTIGKADSAQAVVEVDEAYASSIKVGDKARLLVGGAWTDGTVTSVGKVAVLASDGVSSTIEVRVKPDVLGSAFIQGASVTAEFPLGSREGVLVLPRGAYLTTGNQRYLYVIEGDKAYRRTVSFGEIKDTWVEVLSGLKEGELVVTSGYQNFIEREVVAIGL